MDDQRRRPDPTSRPDPYELAVARAASSEDRGPGQEEGSGAPPLPRLQAGPFRVSPVGLLLGVLLLVGVGSLVRFDADRTPVLAPSCTTHALALSADRVRPGGLVEYAVVGRPGEVGLSLDQLRGDGEAAVPGQQLPPVALPQSCRTTGRFGAQVPPGDYTVSVLVDGEPVATEPLTVTELGDPSADG